MLKFRLKKQNKNKIKQKTVIYCSCYLKTSKNGTGPFKSRNGVFPAILGGCSPIDTRDPPPAKPHFSKGKIYGLFAQLYLNMLQEFSGNTY